MKALNSSVRMIMAFLFQSCPNNNLILKPWLNYRPWHLAKCIIVKVCYPSSRPMADRELPDCAIKEFT